MTTFKLIVSTKEEWEYYYEMEAKNLEEAKAMAEQRIIEPTKSEIEDIIITGIREG